GRQGAVRQRQRIESGRERLRADGKRCSVENCERQTAEARLGKQSQSPERCGSRRRKSLGGLVRRERALPNRQGQKDERDEDPQRESRRSRAHGRWILSRDELGRQNGVPM